MDAIKEIDRARIRLYLLSKGQDHVSLREWRRTYRNYRIIGDKHAKKLRKKYLIVLNETHDEFELYLTKNVNKITIEDAIIAYRKILDDKIIKLKNETLKTINDCYEESYYAMLKSIPPEYKKETKKLFPPLERITQLIIPAIEKMGDYFVNRITGLVDKLGESIISPVTEEIKSFLLDQTSALNFEDLIMRLINTEMAEAEQRGRLEALIEVVGVKVMYLSARDDKVCEDCWEWDGEEFIPGEVPEDAHPPLHPNCRCVLIAMDNNGNIIELED